MVWSSSTQENTKQKLHTLQSEYTAYMSIYTKNLENKLKLNWRQFKSYVQAI